MAKIQISKEELEHDEVLESADVVLHWLKENLSRIVFVVAVVVAGYGIFGYVSSREEANLMQANDLLSEAQSKYDAAVAEHGWATDERARAMEEVIAMTDQIIEEYEGSPLARLALLLKGNAYFSTGDSIAEALRGGAVNTERALEIFQEYVLIAEREGSPLEIGKGMLAQGYAYENIFFLTNQPPALGDAIRTYGEIIDNEELPGFIRAEAMLAQGRMYAFQGETESAIELYRRVLEERFEPYEPLDEEASANELLVRQLEQQQDLFSLAGTARLELQRLGVDVEEEYPLTAAEANAP